MQLIQVESLLKMIEMLHFYLSRLLGETVQSEGCCMWHHVDAPTVFGPASFWLVLKVLNGFMCALSASSAAQGGGRGFKNRKPIGQVSCRESRMAEPIH